MKRQLIELSGLFFSSLISVAVVFLKIPGQLIQQIIAVLVIILLIAVHRFIFVRKQTLPFSISLALIILISIFIQLLVLSSGGFYSPFLILFHLFAISVSFLISIRLALGFLGFSIIALLTNTLLDGKLYSLLVNDPWSAVLYILSFAAIVPLYQLISNTYRLEKAVARILSTQLQQKSSQLELTQKRDESLLGGLSDLVITTGLDLGILSLNEAASRTLHAPTEEAAGRPIFRLLNLKDMNGRTIDARFLSIDEIIESGTTHLLKDLLLYTGNAAVPRKINLRIHPTRNLAGQIDQVVFIISNFFGGGHSTAGFENIDEAVKKNRLLLFDIRQKLREQNLKQLDIKVELLGKTEEDILTAVQIANHGIQPDFSLLDAADAIQRLLPTEKAFAANLGIPLILSLSQDLKEKFASIDVGGGQPIPLAFTIQYFTAFTEPHWFNFLMKKILDLMILLDTREKQPKVEISLAYDAESVTIDVNGFCSQPTAGDINQLLSDRYLDNGSGLEGYLIKTISILLNIPLSVSYQAASQTLHFTVKLSKTPPH